MTHHPLRINLISWTILGVFPLCAQGRQIRVIATGTTPTAGSGTVIHVDGNAGGPVHDGSSWCSAFLRLDKALTAAVSGDAVRVADGTYTPDPGGLVNPREATLQLKNGVRIEGGYAGCGAPNPDERDIAVNITILSGDLNGDDDPAIPGPSGGTCCSLQPTPGCDDATCESAVCAERATCCSSQWHNSCVDLALSLCCDLCARNLTLCDNAYHVVSATGTDATTVLDGFTVVGGNADGSVFDSMPKPRSGGGMWIPDGDPTVIHCKFTGNFAVDGGGMFIGIGSPIIDGCVFAGNTAEGRGGGVYHFVGRLFDTYDTAKLVNCLFTGNSARVGGGLNVHRARMLVSNCTFVANTITAEQYYFGAGISSQGILTVVNSILWGNTSSGVMIESAQIFGSSADYSCIQGLTPDFPGMGNIGDDPLFVDPDGPDDIPGTPDDNLRLGAFSPCIDAGNNNGVPLFVTTDLDGLPRIVDGDTNGIAVVDMGATETGKAIPTLTEWGMVVMALLILTAGTMVLGRSRTLGLAFTNRDSR